MEKLPIDIINKIFEFSCNNKIVKNDPKNKNNYVIVFSSYNDFSVISNLYKSTKLRSNKKFTYIDNNSIYWYEISNSKWCKRFISKTSKIVDNDYKETQTFNIF
jgi:hypothetical protein